MAKLIQMISDSLKERVEKATSKPKRRMITSEIVASSDEHREAMCKELRGSEHQERQTQLVPVLMLFGEPRKVLTSNEVSEYKSHGCRIDYYPRNEVKSLIK